MSTFVCDECGCMDNTAVTRFWFRDVATDGRALCSECDKDGPSSGEWHGFFEKKKYDPDYHVGYLANR